MSSIPDDLAKRPAEKKKRVRVQELNNSKENRRQFQQCLTERTRERDGEENAHGQIEEQWTILKGDINVSIEEAIGFKWSSKTKTNSLVDRQTAN